jgi:hypothetical protein
MGNEEYSDGPAGTKGQVQDHGDDGKENVEKAVAWVGKASCI